MELQDELKWAQTTIRMIHKLMGTSPRCGHGVYDGDFEAIEAAWEAMRERAETAEAERDVFKQESQRAAWPTDAQEEVNSLRTTIASMKRARNTEEANSQELRARWGSARNRLQIALSEIPGAMTAVEAFAISEGTQVDEGAGWPEISDWKVKQAHDVAKAQHRRDVARVKALLPSYPEKVAAQANLQRAVGMGIEKALEVLAGEET